MFSATEITGNVFYKVHWGLHLGGGRDIHACNNVLVDCTLAIHLDARALGWAALFPDLSSRPWNGCRIARIHGRRATPNW